MNLIIKCYNGLKCLHSRKSLLRLFSKSLEAKETASRQEFHVFFLRDIRRTLSPRGPHREVWAELEPAAAIHEAAGRWSLHKRTAPQSFHPGKDPEDNFPQSVVIWRVC